MTLVKINKVNLSVVIVLTTLMNKSVAHLDDKDAENALATPLDSLATFPEASNPLNTASLKTLDHPSLAAV